MKKYSMSSKQIIRWIFINYGLFILAFFSLGFMSNIKSVVVINFVLDESEWIRTGYYGYKIPSRNLSERSEKMRCEPIENGRAPPNPESGVIGG